MKLATPSSIKRANFFHAITFVLLVIGILVAGITAAIGLVCVFAAFFSAMGYVVFLLIDNDYTFWTGAAAGFGSLIILVMLNGILVNTIKAFRK